MSDSITKHFVEFYSPGTFVAESTVKPIDSWDVKEAVKMMSAITERYGAKPYGFRFITRTRGPDDLDSKQADRSPMHYVDVSVRTYQEVVADGLASEKILRDNMRINGFNRVVCPRNGWKFTQPMNPDDVAIESSEYVSS